MDKLLFGLSVALIGMLVVFVGLVILIGSIKLISLFVNGKKTKTKAEDGESVPEVAELPVVTETAMVETVNDSPEAIAPEVLVAITMAIAAVWQGNSGFIVRHVRRVNNAPAWNRAGRDDQVYSRM